MLPRTKAGQPIPTGVVLLEDRPGKACHRQVTIGPCSSCQALLHCAKGWLRGVLMAVSQAPVADARHEHLTAPLLLLTCATCALTASGISRCRSTAPAPAITCESTTALCLQGVQAFAADEVCKNWCAIEYMKLQDVSLKPKTDPDAHNRTGTHVRTTTRWCLGSGLFQGLWCPLLVP